MNIEQIVGKPENGYYKISPTAIESILQYVKKLENESAEYKKYLSETQIWAIQQAARKIMDKTESVDELEKLSIKIDETARSISQGKGNHWRIVEPKTGLLKTLKQMQDEGYTVYDENNIEIKDESQLGVN